MNRRQFMKAASLVIPAMAGCSSRSVPEFSEQAFDQQADAIHAIAYSPDGSSIATAHSARHPDGWRVHWIGIPQGYVRLWSAQDQTERSLVAAEKLGRMPFPHFAVNGDVIVLAEDGIVLCDNAGSVRGERRPIQRVQLIDAQRQRLVCSIGEDPSCVIVTDFRGNPLSKELRHPKEKSIHPEFWRGLSPDGKLLATTSFQSTGEVFIWDWETAEVIARIQTTESRVTFWQAAFAPDSKSVAVVNSAHEVRLYDIGTGRLRKSFECPSGLLIDVCFSPKGQRIAVCGEGTATKSDKQFGFIKIWDVISGEVIADLKRPDVWGVTAISFAPDGTTLSAGLSNGALVAYTRNLNVRE